MVELLISVVLSVVVMGASLSFALAAFRGTEGNKLREEVYRNSRFIGMSLERDIQTTGVGIASEIRFGTLNVFNDTLVVIHVPWEPTDAFPYVIDPPAGVNNPLDPGGTCGSTCIDLTKAPDGTFDLVPGDIARLQINAERRVVLVTDVRDMGNKVQMTFSSVQRSSTTRQRSRAACSWTASAPPCRSFSRLSISSRTRFSTALTSWTRTVA